MSHFAPRCLSIDLEVGLRDTRIHRFAAVRGDQPEASLHFRQGNLPAALEQLDVRLSDVQRLPGDTLDEKLEALRRCVAALPDHYQATIDGRFREQLSPPEIASRLQLNLETVKKRLHRARAMLLDCMLGKLAALEGDA